MKTIVHKDKDHVVLAIRMTHEEWAYIHKSFGALAPNTLAGPDGSLESLRAACGFAYGIWDAGKTKP